MFCSFAFVTCFGFGAWDFGFSFSLLPAPRSLRYQLTSLSPCVTVEQRPGKRNLYVHPHLELYPERLAEDLGRLAGRRRFPAQRGDGLLCGIFVLPALLGVDLHPGLRAAALAAGRQRPGSASRTGQAADGSLAGRSASGPACRREGERRVGRTAGGRDVAGRRDRRLPPTRLHVRPHFRRHEKLVAGEPCGAMFVRCSTIAFRPSSCSWPSAHCCWACSSPTSMF